MTKIVDLRSDTVTQPTAAMRTVALGDDVFAGPRFAVAVMREFFKA